MKHRLERVRALIKRELGVLIQRDLTFAVPLVSIVNVDITPDLKQAHIFVSAIGSDADRKSVLETLERHRSTLQHELSRRVIIKFTPRLNFKMDDSIERGTRLIHIMDDLGLKHENPEDEEEDDEHDPRNV